MKPSLVEASGRTGTDHCLGLQQHPNDDRRIDREDMAGPARMKSRGRLCRSGRRHGELLQQQRGPSRSTRTPNTQVATSPQASRFRCLCRRVTQGRARRGRAFARTARRSPPSGLTRPSRLRRRGESTATSSSLVPALTRVMVTKFAAVPTTGRSAHSVTLTELGDVDDEVADDVDAVR